MMSSRGRSFSSTHAVLISALVLVVSLGFAAIAAPSGAFAADLAAGQGAEGALSSQSDNAITWKLSKNKVTLKSYLSTKRIYLKDPKGVLWSAPSAYSTNSAVVTVADTGYDYDISRYYVDVRKAGRGKATIQITGSDGMTRNLKVVCKATPLKLYYSKVVFSKKNPMNSITLSPQYEYDKSTNASHEPDNVIKRVKNSNKKVAAVKLVKGNGYSYVSITPKKVGKTKVTVIDQFGYKRVVPVTVTKSYFKENLKYRSYCSGYYGNKEITGWTAPGAKATLRIGKTTMTRRADKDGKVVFKMKRFYKLDKKFKVTYKTKKAKATETYKIGSQVSGSFGTFWSCKKYVPVTVRHVTKGDVITLSGGYEQYTRTVYASSESYSTTFYFNYTMRNYSTLYLKVHNKYGQQLYTYAYTIRWS